MKPFETYASDWLANSQRGDHIAELLVRFGYDFDLVTGLVLRHTKDPARLAQCQQELCWRTPEAAGNIVRIATHRDGQDDEPVLAAYAEAYRRLTCSTE